jgi:Ni/Co efflux regulator RcnB
MRNLLAAAAGLYLICGSVVAQDSAPARTPDEGAPPGNSMQHEPGRPMPDNRTDRGTLGDRTQPGFHSETHLPNGSAMMRRGHVHPGGTDFDRFGGNFHAEHRFHAGEWHGPQYRHWTFGERLPPAYYSRSLWIGSYGIYGLMAPPADAVWVRSGPDALLVDRATGEVIRVEYGIFYESASILTCPTQPSRGGWNENHTATGALMCGWDW